MLTSENETEVTLERGGREIPEDAPFRLLLAGNWSGNRGGGSLSDRRPVEIDRDNFEDVMHRLGTGLRLDLPGGAVLSLQFAELDDFHPDNIFRRVPLFENLRDARRRLKHEQTFEQAAREVRGWFDEPETPKYDSPAPVAEPQESGNLLDQILSQSDSSPVPTRTVASAPKNELDALLGKFVRPHLVRTDENEQSRLVEAVDRATGELMRAVLHHPDFQRLEAAWRGVHLVTSRADTDSNLKIYLLDATKEELAADLKAVGSLVDSAFYQLLDAENRGEEPWAAVCADYVFEPNVDDAATLMRLGKIASRFDASFVAQGSPKVLGTESLAASPDPGEWRLPADSTEAKLWDVLRAAPESAYIGLTVPRLLARLPYGAKTKPLESFSFEETGDSPAHEQYVWMNSSFALALLMARSFSENGWEFGGDVPRELENVPLHIYRSGGETIVKPGAEVFLTQKAAERIWGAGLMLFVSFRDSDAVRLVRYQSIAEPETPLRGRWI